MDHFEMVEKLRERTGVSYEEAKAALEAADWDLLDAIVVLESEGKVAEGAKDYSTRREESRADSEKKRGEFKNTMGRIGRQLASLIDWGNKVFVDVQRRDKDVLSLPLTVVVVLLIVTFPWVIPLLIVSLFFGYTYSIRSNGAGIDMVNQAMGKASEFANNIKQEAAKNHHDNH